MMQSVTELRIFSTLEDIAVGGPVEFLATDVAAFRRNFFAVR
jgi:hypothetical protein